MTVPFSIDIVLRDSGQPAVRPLEGHAGGSFWPANRRLFHGPNV